MPEEIKELEKTLAELKKRQYKSHLLHRIEDMQRTEAEIARWFNVDGTHYRKVNGGYEILHGAGYKDAYWVKVRSKRKKRMLDIQWNQKEKPPQPPMGHEDWITEENQ